MTRNNTGSAAAARAPQFPAHAVEDMTAFFKVLGDETRMRIVLLISEESRCTGDIAAALNMSDSAVSHQLKALKAAGLVRTRREGKNIYYLLDDEHVNEIISTALAHTEHKRQHG
jgi:ArsR family transcriptional regulator